MAARPVLAVSMGDPAGCGPEALVAALARGAVLEQARLVVFGDLAVMREAMRCVGRDVPLFVAADPREIALPEGRAVLVPVVAARGQDAAPVALPGKPVPGAGALAHRALLDALDFVQGGAAEGLVTLPVSKSRIVADGIAFTGHTEVLAERCGGGPAVMLFVSPVLRVALCTVHVPLARVADVLTRRRVSETITVTARTLHADFGIAHPRIVVCGLNPHAGEGGLLGREDAEVIAPGIEDARRELRETADVRGPVAADAAFGGDARATYDVAVAMYHDQGLAPLKALARFAAVNFTAGLAIVRGSPAHGTADDVAGTGRVRPDGVEAAVAVVADVARRRRARATSV